MIGFSYYIMGGHFLSSFFVFEFDLTVKLDYIITDIQTSVKRRF